MPNSEPHHISLRRQYDNLLRDWDDYKTSIPRHRRSHSAANFDPKRVQFSPPKLISLKRTDQSGGWETFDNIEATKSECSLVSFECCSSSSVPVAYNENIDEGSNFSDNDGDDWGEKDNVRGGKQEKLKKRMRWFGIVMVVVVLSVFSFGFVFRRDDVGQLMTPT